MIKVSTIYLLSIVHCVVTTTCTEVELVRNGYNPGKISEYYCIGNLPTITSNTEVRLASGHINLEKSISIENASDISITGYNSTIACTNGTTAGLILTISKI